MKRLGLVGCGVVASYGHIPAIAQLENLTLTAVFDLSLERAEAARDLSGTAIAFTDFEAFLHSGLDAVIITSPAIAHHGNVMACARAGLPVLCEKPLAMSEAEAIEMIAAMEAAGQLLVTGFDYRFSPVSFKIRELVRGGAIGEIRAARLIYNWALHGEWLEPGKPDSGTNERRVGRMLEGGPMVDCGVHQIDLARWWFGGEVTSWTAQGAWIDEYEWPDHVWLHMEQETPLQERSIHTMVEMSYAYGHRAKDLPSQFRYEIIGTDGVILFDRERKNFELRNTSGTQHYPFAWEKNFLGMYQAFSHALHTGEAADLPTGEDGRIATKIANEATEAVVRQQMSTVR